MSFQELKSFLTFKLPTFIAWAATRPFVHLWHMDSKSLIYPSLIIAAYGLITNNRPLLGSASIVFALAFLKKEYQGGEWLHWHRQKQKRKIGQEKITESSSATLRP